jgi:hypothetical protein
MTFRF